MVEDIIVDNVREDLKRIQSVDPESLVQKGRLGEMAFEDAVAPAKKLIGLFSKISIESIDEFPPQQMKFIQDQSKSTFALLDQILNFKMASSDPESTREMYIRQLQDAYQPTFDSLYPLISYLVSRTVDFGSLEVRGRVAVQSIADEKDRILSQIKETSEQANALLASVRDAAAEQGVTQAAKYFGDEASSHGRMATRWLVVSAVVAMAVLAFSISTLFITKFLPAKDALESTQIITSKILIFGVLVYGLLQCVRVYSAHQHNSVTNKHRQNALMTYRTLAEAGQSPELRDAVLQHAAAAIYAPNDSGYLKGEERGYGSQSLLALLPRLPGGNVPGGGAS